ncbi:hypothetical protein VFPBJ_11537 [Purpureocillium lilacinum]|uniref:Uncharacterized protein n=1 Tax=Purpureocillium lilacinum TaxID=33203 RepID=A0A179F5W8_PURLI|nr:hypothetical protein VFPBJ_11537 [Purpureocillium lilacinum]
MVKQSALLGVAMAGIGICAPLPQERLGVLTRVRQRTNIVRVGVNQQPTITLPEDATAVGIPSTSTFLDSWRLTDFAAALPVFNCKQQIPVALENGEPLYSKTTRNGAQGGRCLRKSSRAVMCILPTLGFASPIALLAFVLFGVSTALALSSLAKQEAEARSCRCMMERIDGPDRATNQGS